MLIHKWVKLYDLPNIGPCYAKIRYTETPEGARTGRLSISGVEGPKANGDARGSCGQCNHDGIVPAEATNISPFAADLLAIWKRWHLNDMRAGCEHQRAEKWDERPIDPSKPLNHYGVHVPGGRPSWNMLTWVTRKEHPEGLLSHPCPVCGYKYGSAWLREPVPESVLAALEAMPDASNMVPTAWLR